MLNDSWWWVGVWAPFVLRTFPPLERGKVGTPPFRPGHPLRASLRLLASPCASRRGGYAVVVYSETRLLRKVWS